LSRFHRLPIARIDRETRDASRSRSTCPTRSRASSATSPGQHLTLKADIDGQDVRRSYSICSSTQDNRLRVAIKRAPEGVFSTYANERLKAGDLVEVMPPMGHFKHADRRAGAPPLRRVRGRAAASRRCCRSSPRRCSPSRARTSRCSTATARPAP
jgi:ferredoxin-NADP reductase